MAKERKARGESSAKAKKAAKAKGTRPVACLNCRTRRSYCSKDRPSCSRYLRELQAKAWAYENGGADIDPERLPEEAGISDASEQEFDEDEDGAVEEAPQYPFPVAKEEEDEEFGNGLHLLEPFNQLGLKELPTTFRGPGSSDNFLKTVSKLSGLHEDDASLDTNPNFYEPGALPSRRVLSWFPVRLPHFDIARCLFAAHAMQQLLAAYRGPPDPFDREACLSYAKVLVLLAFGQMYSVNRLVGCRGPGFDYFSSALSLLPETYEEGSISATDKTDDAALREHRRRVWWSIYSLDRILSVKSGNPVTIHDEDIGVNLPSRLPHEPEYCAAVVLRHYTQLSRILGKIHATIYRRSSGPSAKSGKSLMASVQEIVLALSEWNRRLPDELRFDPARLSVSRESVSTFSHYYQCISMTVRPLLFHVVQRRLQHIRASGDPAAKEQDWRLGLSSSTVRMIDLCINGAKDVVHMMTWAAQKDLVATYGYMDGDHVFSAAIALVMACVAFPTDASNTAAMEGGLTLLKTMSARGNTHIAARYELLDNIRKTSLGSAPAPAPAPAPSFSSPGFTTTTSSSATPASSSSPPTAFSFSPAASAPSRRSGIDDTLWEEVFANPTVESGFDFPGWPHMALDPDHWNGPGV
ncbi:unnamed protein product [Parascedosporium putredinis]|uniref:Xylanolytic transcriptional activator regulatory domain-containing protein n=1 Tax=Parascedosporium putredinis TaxID=1442378 RepID=A0A9P1MCF4_9PEZI|nr:unnamed protein product [Parascedosporium putredinis]CAI7998305.1 unnamed protein product [Parascedosporium putredinis]